MAITSWEYKRMMKYFLGDIKNVDEIVDLLDDMRVIVKMVDQAAEDYAYSPNMDITKLKIYIKNFELKREELAKYNIMIHYHCVSNIDTYKPIFDNNKRYFIKIYTLKRDMTDILCFKKDKKEVDKKFTDIEKIIDFL